jgi:hypothetical protein
MSYEIISVTIDLLLLLITVIDLLLRFKFNRL